MLRKDITVCLKDGQVARPVAMFVQVASRFNSRIYIENGSVRINAKSIMGMMTLGMEDGRIMTVSADGQDEELAMEKIEEFLTSGV